MVVFIDTSAWLAMVYHNDRNHKQAVSNYKDILEKGHITITSDYILDETITRIRYDTGHQPAVYFIDNVHKGINEDFLKVETVKKGVFNASLALFKEYNDQSFSFTDCTSFVLCKEKNIKKVFAYDIDFEIMGFELFGGVN